MSYSEPVLSNNTTRNQTFQTYPRITTLGSDFIASQEKDSCLPYIKPIRKQSGFAVAAWFKAFFQVVIGLSTLGTSVTFNYVLSDFKNPNFLWSKPQIQTYLAISWVLFLLSLAFAGLASTLLNFFQGQMVRDWDGQDTRTKRVLQYYALVTFLVVYGLVIAAFVMMGLVVAAYSFAVGWVAVGFAAVFGVGGLSCLILVSPLCSS